MSAPARRLTRSALGAGGGALAARRSRKLTDSFSRVSAWAARMTAAPPGPSSIHVMSISSGSGGWLELDDRKGPVGLSLHLVVGGVRPDEGRPAAVTFVRGEDPGEIGIGLTAPLDGGAGAGGGG